MKLQTSDHRVALHLRNSQRVVRESRALAAALGSVRTPERRDAEVQAAIDMLTEAAVEPAYKPEARQEGIENNEILEQSEPLTCEQTLEIAAADAATAHLLYAASEAVGERSNPAGAVHLQTALQSVEAQAAQPGKQRFSGKAVHFASVDIAQALEIFRAQANESLKRILEESQVTIEKVFHYLGQKLGDLSGAFTESWKLWTEPLDGATLLQGAWKKLLSALEGLRSLTRLLRGHEAVENLVELARSATLRGALEKILGSASLNKEIEVLDCRPEAFPQRLDELSSRLALLEERFTSLVQNIRRVAIAVGTLGSLIAAHFTGPFAALAVPAAHSLAIVAVLVLAQDFMHSGHLNAGSGLLLIINEFKAIAQG